VRIFSGRDVFVFDLDNTLYPANHDIFIAIGARMTDFIARAAGLPHDEALKLQNRYYELYGATVTGLMRRHGVDPAEFMAYVHDVPLDGVAPDPELAALIGRLPGRRIVFTNGARAYARDIIAHLGMADVFERIVALEDVDWAPKPQRTAFERMAALTSVTPARAVMFEDHLTNLATANAMGMATVLVGHDSPPAPFVDHATSSLHAFLHAALTSPGAAPSQQA
jgi:putative hydrolase of the HAD superfamily